RVWLNRNGVAIGLRPGWARDGWYDEAADVAQQAGLPGFRLLAGHSSRRGDDVGFTSGYQGEFVYARWFPREELADLDLRREVVAAAAALQPVLDELLHRATGEQASDEDDPLRPVIEQFRTAAGYPTPADDEHRAHRSQLAEVLAEDALGVSDRADVSRIWSGGRYGGTGPQSVLNTSFRDADEAEYDRIVDTISYLCWGDGDDADRIDAVLDPDGTRYVRGLGESVIM